jgi:hypothetical protein
MNLHAIAGPIVAAVNPWVLAQYRQPAGTYTTAADGTRTPDFLPDVDLMVQRQALSPSDLRQIEGLNLGGEKAALYVQGDIKGTVRGEQRGGDLFVMPDGTTWLVVQALENWGTTAGWTKVACVRQA